MIRLAAAWRNTSVKAHHRDGSARDHVSQDLAGADRGQLIDIADDEQGCPVRDRLDQSIHQQARRPSRFIDNQQIAVERVGVVAPEAAALGIDFEEAVDGLGLRSCAWRRGRWARTAGGSHLSPREYAGWPEMIHYVALPFARTDGGFVPCEAVECPHAAAAVRRAEAMSHRDGISGAVAFYRRGNLISASSRSRDLKTFGDLESVRRQRRADSGCASLGNYQQPFEFLGNQFF